MNIPLQNTRPVPTIKSVPLIVPGFAFKTGSRVVLAVFLAWFLPAIPLRAAPQAFDHSHAPLTQVLQARVQDDLVDYQKLKQDPSRLNQYLDQLALVTSREFKDWTQNQQIAFLVNLYNAATLKLIIDHYPLESIKDIGWLLKGPWDQKVVRLFGKKTTLGHVEHEILREQYNEPRIHFALVCAALGCPPLRTEAYEPSKLDQQFEDQGRAFLQNTAKNRVNTRTKTLYLSPIFDWFEKDFTQKAGTVQKFVAPYFKEEAQKALGRERYKIRYTDYDWSLNDGSEKK